MQQQLKVFINHWMQVLPGQFLSIKQWSWILKSIPVILQFYMPALEICPALIMVYLNQRMLEQYGIN